jgi:hypothetical protein
MREHYGLAKHGQSRRARFKSERQSSYDLARFRAKEERKGAEMLHINDIERRFINCRENKEMNNQDKITEAQSLLAELISIEQAFGAQKFKARDGEILKIQLKEFLANLKNF